MGAGFQSGNGLKACLNGFLWSTYVVPRLTYGLEVLTLRKKDIDSLEKFQRKSLKQLQGLPDKTPNVICTSLLGILPIETVIEKNALILFMNIIRDQDSIEYQIAERQLAMKDISEKSWFNYVKSVLSKYNMPSIYSLLESDISNSEWKTLLNYSINFYVEEQWKKEAKSKSSLKYVNSDCLKVGQSHPVWSTVRCNVIDNKRAQLKCKLLTGTYILQGNRAVFNQHAVDPTCKLCNSAPETRQHLIAECQVYATERYELTGKLLNNPVLPASVRDSVKNPEILTQLMLDGSAVVKGCDSYVDVLDYLELQSRDFIYKIHQKRIAKLKLIA